MTRVALWTRVSADESDPKTQLEPLRAFAAQLGGEVVKEYVLNESATGKRGRRVEFDQMMKDASKRYFDLLLFLNMTRFSREGIRKTIAYFQQLDVYGVRYKSLQEPFLDTENELIAYMVKGLLAYFAHYQANQISEATKRKLAHLKAQGVKLGRPSKFKQLEGDLVKLKRADTPPAEVARRLGISYNSARTYLRRLEDDA